MAKKSQLNLEQFKRLRKEQAAVRKLLKKGLIKKSTAEKMNDYFFKNGHFYFRNKSLERALDLYSGVIDGDSIVYTLSAGEAALLKEQQEILPQNRRFKIVNRKIVVPKKRRLIRDKKGIRVSTGIEGIKEIGLLDLRKLSSIELEKELRVYWDKNNLNSRGISFEFSNFSPYSAKYYYGDFNDLLQKILDYREQNHGDQVSTIRLIRFSDRGTIGKKLKEDHIVEQKKGRKKSGTKKQKKEKSEYQKALAKERKREQRKDKTKREKENVAEAARKRNVRKLGKSKKD